MATENSPEELDPELSVALAATVTQSAPVANGDYWDTIDSSLADIESENGFDIDITDAKHSTSEPAIASSSKKSRSGLKKSMLTAAASVVLLAGGLFVYNNTGGLEDITSAADSGEAFEEVGDNIVFEEVAAEATERASDESASDAATEAFDDVAEEAEETSADSDDSFASLEDSDWFNAKSSSKILVSAEAFDPSVRINSASDLISSNEFFVYSFEAQQGDDLRVILSSAGLEVTYTLYGPDGEVIEAAAVLTELESIDAGTYSVAVESVGESELEFEVSFQLTDA